MKLKHVLTVVTAVAAISSQGFAAKDDGFSAPQKKQVEQVIHDYLVSHPEVLVEASQVLQQKQQKELQLQAQNAILEQSTPLFKGQLAVAGDPKGNVTLVEFFDYQCVHCKKMKPVVQSLTEKNKNLRVVYKEFPIFGKTSEFASQAALAAAVQGKYKAMQDALLSQEKPLTDAIVLDAAKSIGLNIDQLKKDMDSQAIKDELAANRQLAEKIHLMGTPAFIIASTPKGQFDTKTKPSFVPGGASETSLQEMINQQTKK
jgi:protein-disulfide isomerase